MASTTSTPTGLDLRGKTISTYILYELHSALSDVAEGDRVEAVTNHDSVITTDLEAWCRTTGHRLVDVVTQGKTQRILIEKGALKRSSRKLAAIISDDGLFELLSPLGFALAAALEDHHVVLYFQGPAVRVLSPRYTARMHGLGRPFSRFPRNQLARAGHLPPQEKLYQIQELGGRIFACGPSMDHYKVDANDLALPNVTVASYPTFMEQMDSADIQLFV